MKKIFADTNIVIDLLSNREPFYYDAAVLFSLSDKKIIELYVSALTIANTSYTLTRQMNSNMAKSILGKLKIIVKILALDDKIIELALNNDNFTDFEDALQYFTAIENGMDIIVTRNLKDFKNSKLPIMTAGQFIKTTD